MCQNLRTLSHYALIDKVIEVRHTCYKVKLYKVFIVDEDRLDGDLSKEELLVVLDIMKNVISPGHDDLPCALFKEIWDTIVDGFYHMAKPSLFP